jgi:hypothetical protein
MVGPKVISLGSKFLENFVAGRITYDSFKVLT